MGELMEACYSFKLVQKWLHLLWIQKGSVKLLKCITVKWKSG